MADIADASIQPVISPTIPTSASLKEKAPLWASLALGAITLLSLFMNFFQLGQNGYGNLYYAAGIRSMTDSWHNFFFVSLDPGGFVTIDKPPLGFWLQALSAKLFGFTPFSIFLPQALCGVLAVVLLYFLVRRHFGIIAGLIAALVLAVSPISVVTDRNNTIDGTLALVLLLSAWAIIRAAETGKLRWLLLSAVCVGVGFNVKMAEAYLVVPALGLAYLLCAPRSVWTRVWHLLLALVVMLVISLSWAAAVDLTPATLRPYVGSTQNNSELSLAFGYNGLNRLHIGGNGFGRPGATNTTRTGQQRNSGTGNTTTAANAANEIEQAQGNGFRSGAASPLALVGPSMGGQIGWLLPFALLAILALAWQRRFRFQEDRQQLGMILWSFWLLTMAIFFTVVGSFHQYYMTEMAPGLSAMVGIGAVTMWKDYRSSGWRGWLLPVALVLTAAAQIAILRGYPSWASWMSPLIGVLTALAVLALVAFRLKPSLTENWTTLQAIRSVASASLLVLLIAPTLWAGYSVLHNVENSDPLAGPAAQGNTGGFGGFGGGNTTTRGVSERAAQRNSATRAFGGFGQSSSQVNPALVSYLEAHQGRAKYLVAVTNAGAAEPFILATNKPVMALGGFSGSDPILTTSQLQALIANGTVRYFLTNSSSATQAALDRLPEQYRNTFNRGGFGGFGQSALSSWVSSHCTAVPASAWQSSASSATGLGGNQLYDCASPRP